MKSFSSRSLLAIVFVAVACTRVRGFSVTLHTSRRLGVSPTTRHLTGMIRQRKAVTSQIPSKATTRLFSTNIVPGIGEEGCNLPSVSGVNTKGKLTQALTVKAIFLSLGVGTYFFSSVLGGFSEFMGASFPWQYEFFRGTWPITFGAVFSLAGITHFTLADEYENIVPTQGAWGIWGVPGSRAFHVAWTGAVELLCGLGLLASGVSSFAGMDGLKLLTGAGLESDCAAALAVLTILVTPANIFMFTHGAKLPMDSDPLPLQFHAIRWVMQVVLLGFLYQMGQGTFQALL